MDSRMDRRNFLKVTALSVGGLALGFYFRPGGGASVPSAAGDWNAWVRIAEDGVVTVMVPKAEMGQGITTSIPMLVAEELEVSWEKVRFSSIEPNQETLKHLSAPTSGSLSIREGYESLRKAGAAAREMLVSSAAAEWGVSAAACRAENGEVVHLESGRKLPYGRLVSAASKLKVPENPVLKREENFKLIGKPVQRLDATAKSNGTAIYGIDASLPGMLVAAIRLFIPGTVLTNLAALQKRAPKGVEFHLIPGGVAAVSESFWTSFSALRSAELKLSGGAGEGFDSSQVTRALQEGLEKRGKVFFEQGEAKEKPSPERKVVTASYEVPYLAHATMEPLTCLADVQPGRCDLWLGTKLPQEHRKIAAEFLGIQEDAVKVHQLYLGGSFGRRGESEFVIQAVTLSRSLGRPVKVVWSREEDMQHDSYRPAFAARLTGIVDKGKLSSWVGVNAGQPISHFGPRGRGGEHDRNSIKYFSTRPYLIPHLRVSTAEVELPFNVGFWRSTGASHNAFFVESFMDELAAAAGADPLLFRTGLLPEGSRELAVLKAAAEASGWGRALPPGQALGIAFTEIADTFVAQVAHVRIERGKLKVMGIFCAYDCGPVIDPGNTLAQIEGGVIFGLSAALHGKITFKHGQAQQSNFHDYPVVRMQDCPRIEVVRVKSEGRVGGIGEVGVPGVAPALCNAIFAASGKRIRRLPIMDQFSVT